MAMDRVNCDAVVEMRFQENAFVVYTREGGPCWIVDPGFAPQHERIAALVTEKQLTPTTIMITHGHSDHIAGIDHVMTLYPGIELKIGPIGKKKLYDANENLSAPFGFPANRSASALPSMHSSEWYPACRADS